MVLPEGEARQRAAEQYNDAMKLLPPVEEGVITSRRRLEGSFGKAPTRRASGEDTVAG